MEVGVEEDAAANIAPSLTEGDPLTQGGDVLDQSVYDVVTTADGRLVPSQNASPTSVRGPQKVAGEELDDIPEFGELATIPQVVVVAPSGEDGNLDTVPVDDSPRSRTPVSPTSTATKEEGKAGKLAEERSVQKLWHATLTGRFLGFLSGGGAQPVENVDVEAMLAETENLVQQEASKPIIIGGGKMDLASVAKTALVVERARKRAGFIHNARLLAKRLNSQMERQTTAVRKAWTASPNVQKLRNFFRGGALGKSGVLDKEFEEAREKAWRKAQIDLMNSAQYEIEMLFSKELPPELKRADPNEPKGSQKKANLHKMNQNVQKNLDNQKRWMRAYDCSLPHHNVTLLRALERVQTGETIMTAFRTKGPKLWAFMDPWELENDKTKDQLKSFGMNITEDDDVSPKPKKRVSIDSDGNEKEKSPKQDKKMDADAKIEAMSNAAPRTEDAGTFVLKLAAENVWDPEQRKREDAAFRFKIGDEHEYDIAIREEDEEEEDKKKDDEVNDADISKHSQHSNDSSPLFSDSQDSFSQRSEDDVEEIASDEEDACTTVIGKHGLVELLVDSRGSSETISTLTNYPIPPQSYVAIECRVMGTQCAESLLVPGEGGKMVLPAGKLMPPFSIGFTAKARDWRSPDDIVLKQRLPGPPKHEKLEAQMEYFMRNRPPGQRPFSVGYSSDGFVRVQHHFGDRNRQIVHLENGKLAEGDTVLFLLDRYRGHLFIFKNGALLKQTVSQSVEHSQQEVLVAKEAFDLREQKQAAKREEKKSRLTRLQSQYGQKIRQTIVTGAELIGADEFAHNFQEEPASTDTSFLGLGNALDLEKAFIGTIVDRPVLEETKSRHLSPAKGSGSGRSPDNSVQLGGKVSKGSDPHTHSENSGSKEGIHKQMAPFSPSLGDSWNDDRSWEESSSSRAMSNDSPIENSAANGSACEKIPWIEEKHQRNSSELYHFPWPSHRNAPFVSRANVVTPISKRLLRRRKVQVSHSRMTARGRRHHRKLKEIRRRSGRKWCKCGSCPEENEEDMICIPVPEADCDRSSEYRRNFVPPIFSSFSRSVSIQNSDVLDLVNPSLRSLREGEHSADVKRLSDPGEVIPSVDEIGGKKSSPKLDMTIPGDEMRPFEEGEKATMEALAARVAAARERQEQIKQERKEKEEEEKRLKKERSTFRYKIKTFFEKWLKLMTRPKEGFFGAAEKYALARLRERNTKNKWVEELWARRRCVAHLHEMGEKLLAAGTPKYHISVPFLSLSDEKNLAYYFIVSQKTIRLDVQVNFGTKPFRMCQDLDKVTERLSKDELARLTKEEERVSTQAYVALRKPLPADAERTGTVLRDVEQIFYERFQKDILDDRRVEELFSECRRVTRKPGRGPQLRSMSALFDIDEEEDQEQRHSKSGSDGKKPKRRKSQASSKGGSVESMEEAHVHHGDGEEETGIQKLKAFFAFYFGIVMEIYRRYFSKTVHFVHQQSADGFRNVAASGTTSLNATIGASSNTNDADVEAEKQVGDNKMDELIAQTQNTDVNIAIEEKRFEEVKLRFIRLLLFHSYARLLRGPQDNKVTSSIVDQFVTDRMAADEMEKERLERIRREMAVFTKYITLPPTKEEDSLVVQQEKKAEAEREKIKAEQEAAAAQRSPSKDGEGKEGAPQPKPKARGRQVQRGADGRAQAQGPPLRALENYRVQGRLAADPTHPANMRDFSTYLQSTTFRAAKAISSGGVQEYSGKRPKESLEAIRAEAASQRKMDTMLNELIQSRQPLVRNLEQLFFDIVREQNYFCYEKDADLWRERLIIDYGYVMNAFLQDITSRIFHPRFGTLLTQREAGTYLAVRELPWVTFGLAQSTLYPPLLAKAYPKYRDCMDQDFSFLRYHEKMCSGRNPTIIDDWYSLETEGEQLRRRVRQYKEAALQAGRPQNTWGFFRKIAPMGLVGEKEIETYAKEPGRALLGAFDEQTGTYAKTREFYGGPGYNDDPFGNFDETESFFQQQRLQAWNAEAAKTRSRNLGLANEKSREELLDELLDIRDPNWNPLVRQHQMISMILTDEDQNAITPHGAFAHIRPRKEMYTRCRFIGCRCLCYEPEYYEREYYHEDYKRVVRQWGQWCKRCEHSVSYHRGPPGKRDHKTGMPVPKPNRIEVLNGDTPKWRRAVDERGHRHYYNVDTGVSQFVRPGTGSFGRLHEHEKRPLSVERCSTCDHWKPIPGGRPVVKKKKKNKKKPAEGGEVEKNKVDAAPKKAGRPRPAMDLLKK